MKTNKTVYTFIEETYYISKIKESSIFSLLYYHVIEVFGDKEKAVQYFKDFVDNDEKELPEWDGTFILGNTNDILCYSSTDSFGDKKRILRLTEHIIK